MKWGSQEVLHLFWTYMLTEEVATRLKSNQLCWLCYAGTRKTQNKLFWMIEALLDISVSRKGVGAISLAEIEVFFLPDNFITIVVVIVQLPSRVWLCKLMDYSRLGSPVLLHLRQIAQMHVHWVGQWCYLTISSSATPSLFLQSFPASGCFPMGQLFSSGGQSVGASASVLPMNVQCWFPLGLTSLISLLFKGLARFFSSTIRKHQFFDGSTFFMVQLSHLYITTGKTIALTIRTFVSKVMSLLCKMLSRFVIAFLPRSKRLLISWLQSPSAVILEPKKKKSLTISTFSPYVCHEAMRLNAMILVLLMLSFKQAYSPSSLPSSRHSLVPLQFLPVEWFHLHIWGCWYFSCFLFVIHVVWHFARCTLHVS